MKKICLIPKHWNDLDNIIKSKKQNDIPNPPTPLVLGGWNYSSDFEKESRWNEYISWCVKYDFLSELSNFTDDDYYYSD